MIFVVGSKTSYKSYASGKADGAESVMLNA